MDHARKQPTAHRARRGRSACGWGLACLIALTIVPTQVARADSTKPRDFEGYWVVKMQSAPPVQSAGVGRPEIQNLPYRPETRALVERRGALLQQLKPVVGTHLGCRPPGGREVVNALGGAVVVQNATRFLLLNQEDRGTWQVYIDQPHSAQVPPTYMGESVARWEGDTLVVDSIGYNGRAEISQFVLGTASPLSDKAHIATRISKSADDSTLTFVSTYTDPTYYTEPFDLTLKLQRKEEHRLIDYDCAETPRADEFARWTYDDDWYRPTCVFPVSDGMMSDKIVCTPPRRRR